MTDVISNINEVTRVSFQDGTKQTKCQKLVRSFHIMNPTVWILLVFLGVLIALLGFSIDFIAQILIAAKRQFADEQSNFWVGTAIWLTYSLFFGFLAASCGRWISTDAEGSGIPEMKSILAGVNIFRYLSFQTLTAKIIGLICASAASLSVGKEGPFVHMSGIIANKLCKLVPIFQHIYDNSTLRGQILAASVAAGVCATFGAPMGGVLFSIEVTATYYVVANLWKAFFCVTCGSLCYILLSSAELTDLISYTNFAEIYLDEQIFAFAFLGILCGLLGSCYVLFTSIVIQIRRGKKLGWMCKRFPYTLTMVLIVSSVVRFFPTMRTGEKATLNQMFSSQDLEDIWSEFGLLPTLLLSCVVKLLITSLSISCPIPAGTFTPVFTAGAMFGRMYGELMATLFFDTRHVAVYSVVGAAALTSSVTHTISVAIIVFELTGQLNYMPHMLVGTLLSFAVANALSMSIYDTLISIRGLPYLPNLKPSSIYKKQARDVMSNEITHFTKKTTLGEGARKLSQCLRSLYKIPIIKPNYIVEAELAISDLRKYLHHTFEQQRQYFSPTARIGLEQYFDRLYHLTSSASVSYIQRNITDDSINVDGDITTKFLDDPCVRLFWNTTIDYRSEILQVDYSPLTISEQSPLAKVHFLFIMLGLYQIYITRKGALVGVITRDSFIKSKQVALIYFINIKNDNTPD